MRNFRAVVMDNMALVVRMNVGRIGAVRGRWSSAGSEMACCFPASYTLMGMVVAHTGHHALGLLR